MPMIDIHSETSLATALGPVTLSADNTPVAVDLAGYRSAEIIIGAGIGGITFSGTNKVEVVLTHSDDDVSYVPVTTADMLGVTVTGSGIIKSFVAAHAAAAHYRYGYKGAKRYLKVLFDFSGTHGTGTIFSALVVKMHGLNKPEANQA